MNQTNLVENSEFSWIWYMVLVTYVEVPQPTLDLNIGHSDRDWSTLWPLRDMLIHYVWSPWHYLSISSSLSKHLWPWMCERHKQLLSGGAMKGYPFQRHRRQNPTEHVHWSKTNCVSLSNKLGKITKEEAKGQKAEEEGLLMKSGRERLLYIHCGIKASTDGM